MMIDEQAENVLLDAEVVGGDAKFGRFGISARLRHGFRPRRNGQLDGAFFPAISLLAADAAGEFLSGHDWQLLGFEDQLFRGSAIGGDDTAQRADIADVPNQRAGINIPDDRDLVPIQIKLGCFSRAPVRGDLRKLAHNKGFDTRAGRFFVVEICPNVADVRISQANDLARVAGIGENFLVSGEAGVENDFTTAARDGASGAAVKYAPVFECEGGGPVLNFGQIVLLASSSHSQFTWNWLPW